MKNNYQNLAMHIYDGGHYIGNSCNSRNSHNKAGRRRGIGASCSGHQTPTTLMRKFGIGSHIPNQVASMSPDTSHLDHELLNKFRGESNRINCRSESLRDKSMSRSSRSNSTGGNGNGNENGNSSGSRCSACELTGANSKAFNKFNAESLKPLLTSKVLQDESGKLEHKYKSD